MPLIRTSFFIAIIIKIEETCYFILRWATGAFKNSYTFRLLKLFMISVKNNFQYSFIGRINKVDWQSAPILYNSRLIKQLSILCKISQSRIIYYLRRSAILDSTAFINQQLHRSPAKIVSSIAAITLLADIVFSIFLKKKIIIFDLFMQFLILFMGLVIILCIGKWKELKETSTVIKYVNRYCKNKD